MKRTIFTFILLVILLISAFFYLIKKDVERMSDNPIATSSPIIIIESEIVEIN